MSTQKSPAKKRTTAKKASTKKTTQKKTGTSKSREKSLGYKQNAQEKKLVKQLTALLDNMDAEGLVFLIEQAHVHLYNMQVVALEEARRTLNEKNTTTLRSQKKKNKRSGIEITRSKDGYVYHIVYEGRFTMFNDDEMVEMIRAAKAGRTIGEAKYILYDWFVRERRDFINSSGLGDIEEPTWHELTALIRKNFKITRT